MHVQNIKTQVKITTSRDSIIEIEETKVNTTFENKYDINIATFKSKFEMFYNWIKPYKS